MLGGTGFLGPAEVEYALERGHTVTLFNRGRTNPDLFPDVEKLRGDRGGDLAALEGRRWDAVSFFCRLRGVLRHDEERRVAVVVPHVLTGPDQIAVACDGHRDRTRGGAVDRA